MAFISGGIKLLADNNFSVFFIIVFLFSLFFSTIEAYMIYEISTLLNLFPAWRTTTLHFISEFSIVIFDASALNFIFIFLNNVYFLSFFILFFYLCFLFRMISVSDEIRMRIVIINIH